MKVKTNLNNVRLLLVAISFSYNNLILFDAAIIIFDRYINDKLSKR